MTTAQVRDAGTRSFGKLRGGAFKGSAAISSKKSPPLPQRHNRL